MSDQKEKKIEPEILAEETPSIDKISIAKTSMRTPLSVALLLIVFSGIAGAVLGYQLIWKTPSGHLATIAVTDRLDRLEQRVSLIEQNLGHISLSSSTSSDPENITDVSVVKGDLIDLAGALKAFETKLNESSVKTKTVQTEFQEGLATILSFVQMQYVARAGLPFETERLVLHNLISTNEKKLIELLNLLEPYALDGVVKIDVLHKEWLALESKVQAAIRKAGAKTWQDRIIVALENLISIRSLSFGKGKTLSFENINADLSAHKIESALKKVKDLSPEVQKITQRWRKRADARIRTEKFLNEVASRLIKAKQLPSPKDEIPE